MVEDMPRRTLDPRADLVGDTRLWNILLQGAYAFDHDDPMGLYGFLLGMRAEGVRLERGNGRVIRLGQGEYGRESLAPAERAAAYQADLTRWLRAAGRERQRAALVELMGALKGVR